MDFGVLGVGKGARDEEKDVEFVCEFSSDEIERL